MKNIFLILACLLTFASSASCPDSVNYSGGNFTLYYSPVPSGSYSELRLSIGSGKGAGNSYTVSIVSKTSSYIIIGNGSGSIDSTSVATKIKYYKDGKSTSVDDCDCNIPLPVKLISFKPLLVNNTVALQWVTATEVNNEKFEIERCGSDGVWLKIGEVPGNRNTSQIVCYAFVDKRPLELNYYRLKQTDYNGNFEYSQIAKVSRVSHETDKSFTAYPNPFKDEVTVAGSTDNGVQLTDSKGAVIALGIKADFSLLSPGIYYLFNGQKTIKLIKN